MAMAKFGTGRVAVEARGLSSGSKWQVILAERCTSSAIKERPKASLGQRWIGTLFATSPGSLKALEKSAGRRPRSLLAPRLARRLEG